MFFDYKLSCLCKLIDKQATVHFNIMVCAGVFFVCRLHNAYILRKFFQVHELAVLQFQRFLRNARYFDAKKRAETVFSRKKDKLLAVLRK